MMALPEPFLTAELDYRRERITEAFAASRRPSRPVVRRRRSLRTARRPHRNAVTLD
ncbi:MAG: hypothetical protein M3445_02175 [Actinomycetota bacterium]|nr:hypothetical protein [Actinomycetota bacterium]